jgi:hypothetical protein
MQGNKLLCYGFIPSHGCLVLKVAMTSSCNGNLQTLNAPFMHDAAFLHPQKFSPEKPRRWDGVLKAGGPLGSNFKRLYSQHNGDAPAYVTMPEAQLRRKRSKQPESKRSSVV